MDHIRRDTPITTSFSQNAPLGTFNRTGPDRGSFASEVSAVSNAAGYWGEEPAAYLFDDFLGPQPSENPQVRQMPPPPAPRPRAGDASAVADSQRNLGQPKKKRWRPSEDRWDAHKESIRAHYMTQNESLEATMKHMEDAHGFSASKRMYKDRLAEWGFKKYLKKDTVKGIIRKTEERKGRHTEIRVGGKVVPLKRVQKAYERQFPGGEHDAADIQTPTNMSDVSVLTPGGNESLTAAGRTDTRAAAARGNPATPAWTPSGKVANSADFGFDILRNNGRGLSLSELQKLREDGMKNGDVIEAEQQLRDVLGGFRHRLTSTHPLTTDIAYQLASLYAGQEKTKEAHEVLIWISDECSSRWGPWHCHTLDHYLRIVRLLRLWSREGSAKHMAYRIYMAIRDGLNRNKFLLVPSWDQSWAADSCEELQPEVLGRLIEEAEDEMQIDQRVRIVNIWLTVGFEGMEILLSLLIERCESGAANLLLPALIGRCCLAMNKRSEGDYILADEQARMARNLLVRMFSEHEDLSQQQLLGALEIAFLHLGNDDEKCDRILSWTMDKLEDSVTTWRGTGVTNKNMFQIKNSSNTVVYIIRAAYEYQQRLGWVSAGLWFERAFGFSSRMFGCRSPRSEILELAIKRKQFSAKDLLAFEELENNSQLLLFSNFLC